MFGYSYLNNLILRHNIKLNNEFNKKYENLIELQRKTFSKIFYYQFLCVIHKKYQERL